MDFLRIWLTGIVNPIRAWDELKTKPAPRWGQCAVLIRFAGTSLSSGSLGLLLGRKPFEPSYLTFLPTGSYYKAQFFLLPVFGLVVWLLMSAIVHIAVRLSGRASDFDQVLNVVGTGMLIPMPAVWLWDWAMIASHGFQMTTMAISHSLFQTWEAAIEAIGFKRTLRLGALPAAGLALLVNALFVLLAMVFVR